MIFILLLLLLLLVLLSLLIGTFFLQVRCILQIMLLQFDGLDTIGDDDSDCKDKESPGSEADSEFIILVGGTIDDDVGKEIGEVQVGCAEKRSRLCMGSPQGILGERTHPMDEDIGRMP